MGSEMCIRDRFSVTETHLHKNINDGELQMTSTHLRGRIDKGKITTMVVFLSTFVTLVYGRHVEKLINKVGKANVI